MHQVFLVIIFVMLSSCNTVSDKKVGYNHLELIREFDSLNLDYFPENPKSEDYFYKLDSINYAKSLGRCGAILVDYLNEVDFNNLIKKTETNEIATYTPNERCLLIVNMLSNEVSGSIFMDYYNKHCTHDYIPIPDFNYLLGRNYPSFFSNEGKLLNSFTIYILKAESGEFMSKRYLSKGIGLPDIWKNGYSGGIALNEEENVAIYWVEAW